VSKDVGGKKDRMRAARLTLEATSSVARGRGRLQPSPLWLEEKKGETRFQRIYAVCLQR